MVDQIVEIALRALSPGINDPFTATICIDHLGQGLRRMAKRRIPSPLRMGKDGALHIIAYGLTFPELADKALSQIRHYGRSSDQVMNALLQTIAAVAPHAAREEDRQALLRHALLIRDAARDGLDDEAERSGVEETFGRAVAVLNDLGR